MIKHLFTNWKTTGIGVLLVVGSIVEIAYMMIEGKPVEKAEVKAVLASLLGGIGLLAAGDADKSQSKEAAKEQMEDTKVMMRGKADVEDK